MYTKKVYNKNIGTNYLQTIIRKYFHGKTRICRQRGDNTGFGECD